MISVLSLLNLISVLLSLTFQILLVRFFGAHLETDVYYLSIAIIQFIMGTFSGFIMDLYIPFYNEIKAKDEIKAKEFAGGVFILMLIVSLIITTFIILLSPYIVKIFATGFNPEKINFTSKLVNILAVSLIFTFLTQIVNATLQANLFIFITYFTPVITPLFNILSLFLLSKKYGIISIIYATVIGAFLTFFISFIYLKRKLDFKFYSPFKNSHILSLLKQNIPLRAGNLLYQFAGPVTTNVLSYFPTGYITLYSYSKRILNILFRIVNSPIVHVLYIKATKFLPKNDLKELKAVLLGTLRSTIIFLIFALVPVLVLFERIFSILLGNKITINQLSIMHYLFLSLIPFYIVISFEIPFTQITIAMKKGVKILKINAMFLILYISVLLLSIKTLGVYAIPLAIFIAQAQNTALYIKFINQKTKIIDKDIIKMIIKLSIFALLLLSINTIFKNNLFYSFSLSLLLIIIWFLIIGKKDTLSAFDFIMKRGEVR